MNTSIARKRDDSEFVLYYKIHLYNMVLELKYLPFYKFNRLYIPFNLMKFLNKYLLFLQQPYLYNVERSSYCRLAVSLYHFMIIHYWNHQVTLLLLVNFTRAAHK